MIVHNNSADFYINELKEGRPFSFTRWGDGEWSCAVGNEGHNCDFHEYFPDMSKNLKIALKNNYPYYKAIWPVTHGQIKVNLQWILDFLNQNKIKVDWANAIVWEDLVIREGIKKMSDQLNKMNYIIVSDNRKRKLNLNFKDFIEVPIKNCYLEKDRIKDDILNLSEKYENPVFGFSASMATNVIVDELFPIIGKKAWMIDFGSIWDPFVHRKTRSYHKEYLTYVL